MVILHTTGSNKGIIQNQGEYSVRQSLRASRDYIYRRVPLSYCWLHNIHRHACDQYLLYLSVDETEEVLKPSRNDSSHLMCE